MEGLYEPSFRVPQASFRLRFGHHTYPHAPIDKVTPLRSLAYGFVLVSRVTYEPIALTTCSEDRSNSAQTAYQRNLPSLLSALRNCPE